MIAPSGRDRRNRRFCGYLVPTLSVFGRGEWLGLVCILCARWVPCLTILCCPRGFCFLFSFPFSDRRLCLLSIFFSCGTKVSIREGDNFPPTHYRPRRFLPGSFFGTRIGRIGLREIRRLGVFQGDVSCGVGVSHDASFAFLVSGPLSRSRGPCVLTIGAVWTKCRSPEEGASNLLRLVRLPPVVKYMACFGSVIFPIPCRVRARF